jgi:uncharacterized membrane protein YfcA
VDVGVALAGLVVGVTVGMTGMGGGALMTPILVLVFHTQPLAAVSSDLVASLVMKPIGGSVHARRGTVSWSLVRWLVIGSVPAAFCGVLILRSLGDSSQVQDGIKLLLGWALLVASVAMVAKSVIQARSATRRIDDTPAFQVKPVATLLIGLAGGLIVGMTSVGSGSLMIVMLLLLYPRLSSKQLVGTDLVQAIPLVGAAALGHALFGDVSLGLTGSLLIGSIPGVYIGARFSARAPDAVIRPVLVFVLVASALKLLGVETSTLGVVLGVLVAVGLPLWGAIDAALAREGVFRAAGHNRTTWVTLQAVGAPFGIGFISALIYFGGIRRSLRRSINTVTTHDSTPAPAS